MYENLNQIVAEQGETLNRLEDNVSYTKHNTKKTVSELRSAHSNEKSIRDQLCGCDFGIMCLAIWFMMAIIFFGIDVSLPSFKS